MTRKVSIFLGGTGANNVVDALSNLGAANAAAYVQANTARDSANAAYNQANTAGGNSGAAYDQANTARNTANDAYGAANTAGTNALNAYGQANDAYTQANTARTTANDSYSQANTAYSQANSAYDAANNAKVTVFANSGTANVTTQVINLVNTSTILVSVANTSGNANITLDLVGTPYDQANTARGTANDAYGQANTARDQANTARDTANTAYDAANNAQVTVYANNSSDVTTQRVNFVNTSTVLVTVSADSTNANIALSLIGTPYDQANSARDQANTARGTANDAYGQANTARDQANNAYAEANLKLNLTGGTITGDVILNGNLFVNGVETIVNTESLTINDPIFLLANNNTTNAVGLGFTAHYGPTQQHTGLIRAHQDNIWYLFEDYDDHILYANNVLDIDNIKLATLKANINANSLLLVGETVATQANLTLAHDQANNARNQANTARGVANDAYSQANTARDQANTARTQANTAYGQANAAYGQANTARTTANDAYGAANTAGTNALNAYAQANSARDQANTARTQANTAYGQANAAYDQANTARTTANNAYGVANNAVVASGGTATQLTLRSYREGINTRTITTSTVTADLSGNNIFDFTLQASTVTITFANAPASGTAYPVTLILRQPGTAANTVAYGNTVNWSSGEAAVLASGIANKLDIVSLITVDGGSVFFAAHSMANVSY